MLSGTSVATLSHITIRSSCLRSGKYCNSAIAEDGIMEINGVAHTFITAGDFAAARAFYGQLLPFLGLTVVADSVNTFYCVGGRTGFGIHGAAPEFAGQRFRQGTVGLH